MADYDVSSGLGRQLHFLRLNVPRGSRMNDLTYKHKWVNGSAPNISITPTTSNERFIIKDIWFYIKDFGNITFTADAAPPNPYLMIKYPERHGNTTVPVERQIVILTGEDAYSLVHEFDPESIKYIETDNTAGALKFDLAGKIPMVGVILDESQTESINKTLTIQSLYNLDLNSSKGPIYIVVNGWKIKETDW